MLGQKTKEEPTSDLLVGEGRFVAHLNHEAKNFLGPRYQWYNKIRNAKTEGLALFREKGLEEQMEATRSALSLVTKTVNNGLLLSYNSVVDGVKNSGTAPEDWLEKVDTGDRSDPPKLNDVQDALIIAWNPLKFLNLMKAVRDKGKGLDFYADGLIKKLTFKIVGFYTEPSNWDASRLGYFLATLDKEANLQDVQSRLGMLKTELDIFVSSYQMFKFGRVRGKQDPGNKNALEETFEVTDQDMVKDLYFQSILVNGLEHFLLRYYLTLLSSTENPKAQHYLTQIFQPALAKVEEIHQRFQASFAMERDKLRLREAYMTLARQQEAQPPVEVVEVKGQKSRKITYNHRRLEAVAFPRQGKFSEKGVGNWAAFLKRSILSKEDPLQAFPLVMEVMNTLVQMTQNAMEGKILVAKAMRDFAEEQERLGKVQLTNRKKAYDEASRKRMREMGKFKSQKQQNMVETIKQELEDMEQKLQSDLKNLGESIEKRKLAHIGRAEQLEIAAKNEREKFLGKNASVVYQLLMRMDVEKKLRGGMVPVLASYIQEDKDDLSHLLYRNLFGVFNDLFPTEKMVLKSTVEGKLELEEHELIIAPEEMAKYQQQIQTRIMELNEALPGIMEYRVVTGALQARLEQIINVGITMNSLMLVLQLPFNAPNQPANKFPGEVVKKLMTINQLSHPMPEHDLILDNVESTAPPQKRLNLNRLQKLIE